jgi:eukaryotic-like serine/threonine-protein kinase
MVWSPGQVLKDGRYTIEKVAGSGRLSVTYVAQSRQGDRVVLKVPSDEVIAGDDFERLQERFVREAFQLQKCKHPHIVKVFDPFQEGKVWCIPMEYIAGTTLAQRDRPQLSEAEALTYVRQVGEALGVLHEVGLIHRDVNPGNVMLRIRDGRSEAVLIDFGLAKDFMAGHYMTTRTQMEDMLPNYRAPELYAPGGERGPYCDLYALGALLYELITGNPPSNANDRQNGKDLNFPGDTSDRVIKAIESAMAMKISDRPASVASWLSGIDSGNFVVSRPTQEAKLEPKPKWNWNWATAIKVMGAMAALVTALTGAINTIHPTSTPPEKITK